MKKIPLEDVRKQRTLVQLKKLLTAIPFTSYGDYAGEGLVGKSNFQVLSKKLSRVKGVYAACGWYDYNELYYDEKELTKRGKEIIEKIIGCLEDYCLYDDEHYSWLELNLKSKALYEFEQRYGEVSDDIQRDFFDTCIIENTYAWIDDGKFAEKYGLERL